jgi:hypothetical protein
MKRADGAGDDGFQPAPQSEQFAQFVSAKRLRSERVDSSIELCDPACEHVVSIHPFDSGCNEKPLRDRHFWSQ